MILSGTIIRGRGNGRRLGFPTANFEIQGDVDDGLYVGWTSLGGTLLASLASIVYIGAPEVYHATLRRAESYILDFPDRNLYGQHIEVEILHKLRNNELFASESLLIAQMKKDEIEARIYFNTHVHRNNNAHDHDRIEH